MSEQPSCVPVCMCVCVCVCVCVCPGLSTPRTVIVTMAFPLMAAQTLGRCNSFFDHSFME